jgi:hypothetical protein
MIRKSRFIVSILQRYNQSKLNPLRDVREVNVVNNVPFSQEVNSRCLTLSLP